MEFAVSDDSVNASPAAHPVFGPEVFRLYLGAAPIDMRLGMDGVLARVIDRFGHAQPHCAYAFVNARGNRMKPLIHDGLGFRLALRRLHSGRFYWVDQPLPHAVSLSPTQWHALEQQIEDLNTQPTHCHALAPAWHAHR